MTGRGTRLQRNLKKFRKSEKGGGKMARPTGEEKERKMTEKSLKNALSQNKLSEKFLEDKVKEYMSFYDDLLYINKTLTAMKNSGNCTLKNYTDATAEKRRISSEMRNILRFLGLKPVDVNLVSGGDADEEL